MSSQLSADVCQSFLVGCDELVDKSLQGAISSLEELEVKAQQLGDVSAAKIVRWMHYNIENPGVIFVIFPNP